MAAFRKYDALLVDETLSSRMTLKQFTSYVIEYGKVYQCGSIANALTRLSGEDNIDMIFVSHHFDQKAIHRFISDAKNTRQGRDSSYILVMESKKQDTNTAVKDVLGGADGLLLEPYSVESLVEITKIAVEVRKERLAAREAAALQFLINEMANQLDQVASNLANEAARGQDWKALKDSGQTVKDLQPATLEIYYDILCEMTMNRPAPRKVFQKIKYEGASSRVKRRLEQSPDEGPSES
ncbi:MAG: hypothetical protein DCC75_04840 [Proteobacteria bacterium]|nr:MAG: hypothetical protein DCC75_04840 [Pseudomonadota bacterium]